MNGHIPAESQLFRKYGEYGIFEDVRKTALEIIVDFVLVHTSEKDLEWLLDIVERDPVPSIRHHTVQCLIKVCYTLQQMKDMNPQQFRREEFQFIL